MVLDNWRQSGIDLDDYFLLQIFGQIHFVVPVVLHGDAPRRETSLAYGGGRTIGLEKGTFISAVLVTEPLAREFDDQFEVERPMSARVIHNPYATVPLSPQVFSAADDEQWLYRDGAWHRSGGRDS